MPEQSEGQQSKKHPGFKQEVLRVNKTGQKAPVAVGYQNTLGGNITPTAKGKPLAGQERALHDILVSGTPSVETIRALERQEKTIRRRTQNARKRK